MKKVILCNLPVTESIFPSSGLAAIAPVFKKHEYRVIISDINLDLLEELPINQVQHIHEWCQLTRESLPKDTHRALNEWLESKISTIAAQQPDVVGVSVFSIYSIRFAEKLCAMLRKFGPGITIICGGAGVSSDLGQVTNHKPFGQHLLDSDLADHLIFGEGEVALNHLLSGDLRFPGINKDDSIQIHDLDIIDPPDYSDFDFSRYRDNRLMVTGSRGCVRKCTFCDIEVTWPKFKMRDPAKIVQEIVDHSRRYNIKKFEFTDSLMNGSVSNWIKFNDLLAEQRTKHSDLQDITYSGQFICRDPSNQDKIMYELMHHAGCRQITVGIESFSERVRKDMKKKFSNHAIDYHFEQCARWHIPNVLLMIVGYPIESQQDHQENIDALYKYKIYSDLGIIFMIRWGLTMHIYRDTPLFKSSQDYGIDLNRERNMDAIYTWVSTLNPGLDFTERVRRRLELHEISYQLGYSQPNTRNELASMITLLKEYQPKKTHTIMEIQHARS